MSGNTTTKPAPAAPARTAAKPDRRIRRTRDTLGDALIQLMQEQPFDSITVQQVLDRAGVSRATFYTHYRDKDDLFLSDVEDFLERMGNFLTRQKAPARRLFPVEELFTHIADVPRVHAAIMASGKAPDFRELAIGCFARSIEQCLVAAGVTLAMPELRATSHALAGSLYSLLDWWLLHNKSTPPKEADALFHRLAWNGIPTQP
jgi:AcrR family transcriptional regulator